MEISVSGVNIHVHHYCDNFWGNAYFVFNDNDELLFIDYSSNTVFECAEKFKYLSNKYQNNLNIFNKNSCKHNI